MSQSRKASLNKNKNNLFRITPNILHISGGKAKLEQVTICIFDMLALNFLSLYSSLKKCEKDEKPIMKIFCESNCNSIQLSSSTAIAEQDKCANASARHEAPNTTAGIGVWPSSTIDTTKYIIMNSTLLARKIWVTAANASICKLKRNSHTHADRHQLFLKVTKNCCSSIFVSTFEIILLNYIFIFP
ncbi:hypothetical protein CIPAW_04G196400 [Carya illinoinensis]|uniref:Uncharacterized protein n=1 Tax=Carya illinoinensis TaxID=32201 RepID=A0A8T1QX42_CARIL|nr:hypothetical protein CIPAW_04G196400 [Carya illinoinensis]